MKKENYSAEELDSWGLLAQARKERKRSKTIENENIEEENKEKIIKKYLEHRGFYRKNAKKMDGKKGFKRKRFIQNSNSHKSGSTFAASGLKAWPQHCF